MRSNIILFGEIGAGKDTAAKILQKHNYKIGRLGLEIRQNVTEYSRRMNIPVEEYRGLLVKYGQGMREIFGKDIWCASLLERNKQDILDCNLCITDARQINEYIFFRSKYKFIPVAIKASELVRRTRVVERDGVDQFKNFNDETEQQAREVFKLIEADPGGITIYNNSTIQHLEKQIIDKILNNHSG